MVYFETKSPNLGKILKVLQWKMLVLFTSNLYILQSNGIFHGHLVHFVVILVYFPVLVCCSEKNLATLLASEEKMSSCYFGNFLCVVILKHVF
jgi:hypothetical protein